MAWASAYTPDFQAFSIVGAGQGTANNDRRLIEATSGTPTVVVDAIDTGRYCVRCDATSGATTFSIARLSSTPRYMGAMCRFRINSATVSAAGSILRFIASNTADNIIVQVNTTNNVRVSFNGGTSWTDTNVPLTTQTVYRMEAFVDYNTGTTHTVKVRLAKGDGDFTEIFNGTGGANIVTGSDISFGTAATAALALDFADVVTYNDVAQYATLPNWRVIGLEPISDGTHSMTANDFKDASSNNLTNSTTTSWDWVNDAPSAAPSTTDFVQQVVLRSTSYMEWNLRAMTTAYSDPVLVCLAAAMHPVGGTTTNAAQFRLNSGGNLSTEAAIDTSIASNTLEYRKHHYPTEPTSGATWTMAMAKALKARFGYDGTSISAPPALDSIMAFIVAPIIIGNATSATSATATGAMTDHAGWASAYTPDFRTASATGAAAGTNAANDRRVLQFISTTPTFVADSIDTGRYALRLVSGPTQVNLSVGANANAPRYTGLMFRMKMISALSVNNFQFVAMTAANVAENIWMRVNQTTGVLAYSFNAGSTYTNSSTSINSGQVYRFEVFVDWGTSTTHTLKVRLDGVEIINATGGANATTGVFGSPNIGPIASQGTPVTADVADFVSYSDSAQYGVMSDWRVLILEPVSDGTHVMTSGDFTDESGTNQFGRTDSWSHVNDAPAITPDTSDFIRQAVLRSTSYMEWNLRAMPDGYDAPVLVCLAAAMHPVGGTTTNAAGFHLVADSTESTEPAIDTSLTSNTLEYRKHHYYRAPSNAVWTKAMVQAPLKVRWGFDGTSIAAPPAVDSIAAFVVAPVLKAGTPPTSAGIVV